jgi:hypothetical protein
VLLGSAPGWSQTVDPRQQQAAYRLLRRSTPLLTAVTRPLGHYSVCGLALYWASSTGFDSGQAGQQYPSKLGALWYRHSPHTPETHHSSHPVAGAPAKGREQPSSKQPTAAAAAAAASAGRHTTAGAAAAAAADTQPARKSVYGMARKGSSLAHKVKPRVNTGQRRSTGAPGLLPVVPGIAKEGSTAPSEAPPAVVLGTHTLPGPGRRSISSSLLAPLQRPNNPPSLHNRPQQTTHLAEATANQQQHCSTTPSAEQQLTAGGASSPRLVTHW